MQDLKSEHRQEFIGYVEANLGCSFSEACVLRRDRSVLEKYETYLQSKNVPCELMFYPDGRYELYLPKAEVQRATALIKQLEINEQNRDTQLNTQPQQPPPKKHKPRL